MNRNINHHMQYPPHTPNFYGLCSPRMKQKHSLIDQIIVKCQSPHPTSKKSSLPKTILSPTRGSKIFENKENSLGHRIVNRNSFEKFPQRKQSLEKNPSKIFEDKENSLGHRIVNRNSFETFPQRKQSLEKNPSFALSHSRASLENKTNSKSLYDSNLQKFQRFPQTNVEQKKQQYYHPLKTKTKIVEFKKNPIPRPPSSINSINPTFYSNEGLTKKYDKIKKDLQRKRNQHIEYCKDEERKLKLYYIEIQNKICQMRARELQLLSEYSAEKLNQFNQCQKLAQEKHSEDNLQKVEREIQKIQKQFKVKVNQTKSFQLQTCLITGNTGVLFSFDQLENHL